MEVAGFSENLGTIYRASRSHISDDSNLHSHRRGNLKPHFFLYQSSVWVDAVPVSPQQILIPRNTPRDLSDKNLFTLSEIMFKLSTCYEGSDLYSKCF
jgi:hypothetical protein